jgi:hypothetical protein
MKGDAAVSALHQAMIDAGVVFVADESRTPYRQRYDVTRALEQIGYPLKKIRKKTNRHNAHSR